MKKTIIEEVEEYVSGLLSDLPTYFTYHNLKHTLDVVCAVNIISNNGTFSKEEVEILAISAWFHDTGFINAYKGHEDESVKIATRFLKKHDYAAKDIELVKRCIIATKISHSPQDQLEKAIRDADVSHLACDDYFNKLSLLKKEWEHVFQQKITDKQWFTDNLSFLKNHQFQTAYCRNNFKRQKQKNMFKNFQKVAGYNGHI